MKELKQCHDCALSRLHKPITKTKPTTKHCSKTTQYCPKFNQAQLLLQSNVILQGAVLANPGGFLERLICTF